MAAASAFEGFPKECLAFLADLAQNNNRTWFQAHREEYDRFVLEPAQEFVFEMGKRLRKLVPRIIADPRVNRSLFRVQRDTRFSRDKTPYKTHLAALFWEGAGPRMECPSFYFHVEPGAFLLGAGIYMFTPAMLDRYRQAVVHPRRGAELARALGRVTAAGPYTIGGAHYKRTPRGFDTGHKNAQWLLHNGLYAMYESKPPRELFGPKIMDLCEAHYRKMLPVHQWLVALKEWG